MANDKYTMTFEVESNEYVLLNPGEYQYTVDSVDYGDYNGGTKIPPCGMVIVNIHVDTDNGRAFLNERFYVCREGGGKIAGFFKSVGDLKDGQKKFTPDWDALPGKTGIVKTKQREYNGNLYNDVDRFVAPKKKAAQPKKSWDKAEW